MSDHLARVLVVDDEPQIRRFLRTALDAHLYAVAETGTGEGGLDLAATWTPDLVVLDLGLPDIDGIEMLRRLREWSAVPVLVLSVRGAEQDKVAALDLGADDFVTKPFGMAEFLARVRAALRRHTQDRPTDPVFTVGGLKLDMARRRLTVDGVEVRLSPKQYRLLNVLAQHAGKVLTHHHLLKEIWGPAHLNDVHYLRIFVRKLRNRIEKDPARPRFLLTELGVGYRLAAQDQFTG
jgi:two-component system, OmpR family, KDP operon response regulator KdpE